MFWLTGRYPICRTNSKVIKEFLHGISTNGIYYGYSIGFEIEINNRGGLLT